jgi:hypothetical protein
MKIGESINSGNVCHYSGRKCNIPLTFQNSRNNFATVSYGCGNWFLTFMVKVKGKVVPVLN